MLPEPPSNDPLDIPVSPMRRRLLAVGQATAFAVLTVVLWFLTIWLLSGQSWVENELVLSVVSLAPAVVFAHTVFVLFNPTVSWDMLGLSCSPRGWVELTAGILAGAAISLAVVGTLWTLGWIVVDPGSSPTAGNEEVTWAPGWIHACMILFLGASSEELLFRGFGLQQLIRATNSWVAIIGTSMIFGLLHAGNPGASEVGLVNTALFGCLFGFLLVRSRSLMTPIGVHFGWNFTLVATGVSLSGLRIKLVDVTLTSAGPALWTGGPYGPEASLLTSLAVPIVIGVVLCRPPKSNTGPRLWD